MGVLKSIFFVLIKLKSNDSKINFSMPLKACILGHFIKARQVSFKISEYKIVDTYYLASKKFQKHKKGRVTNWAIGNIDRRTCRNNRMVTLRKYLLWFVNNYPIFMQN